MQQRKDTGICKTCEYVHACEPWFKKLPACCQLGQNHISYIYICSYCGYKFCKACEMKVKNIITSKGYESSALCACPDCETPTTIE